MTDQRMACRAALGLAALLVLWLVAAAVQVGVPALDAETRGLASARLLDFAAVLLGVSALWWGARRRAVLGQPLALAAALLAALAVALVGLAPLVALALVLAPALWIGHRFSGAVASPGVRLVLGLGVVAAVTGWILPFPVFSPSASTLVLAAITVAGRRSIRLEIAGWAREMAPETAGSGPGAAGWAWVLAVVVGSMPAWLPVRNPDDLALRVGLGYELLDYGHARFDVGTQVWALSPWNSEVLHGLMTLLAQGEASGPLGALWVLLSAWLVRGIAVQLGAAPVAALWAGALYASLPITAFLAGGLQTEAMSAALLAALVTVLLQYRDQAPAGALVVVALLSGAMLGTKVSNALFLFPVGLWLVSRWWTGFPARALPLAVLAGFLAGGASYAYAWSLTGNPVLPLMNGVFNSPWFPATDFVDSTWQAGLHWTMPWVMLVDSKKYFEGIVGAAGFSPILILALLPVAVMRPQVRAAALVGIAAFVLVIAQVQYLRYAHPALVLVIPALVAGLPVLRWVRGLLLLLVVVQCALLPSGSWMFLHGILRDRVVEGEHVVLERYAPEKLLAEDFRAMASPSDRVLMTDPLRGFVALLPGRAVGANWHNPRVEALRIVDWDAPGTWRRIIRETGANHLIIPAEQTPAWVDVLVPQRSAAVVSRRGQMQLVALPAAEDHPVRVTEIAAEQGVVVEADIDRTFAWTGTIRLQLSCDEPGEPLMAAWTMTQEGMPVTQQWDWLWCARGGLLAVDRDVELPAGSVDHLSVTISRARPDSSIAFELGSAQLELRRDLLAETDLADALLVEGCRGFACAHHGPRFMERPVQVGRRP